MRLLFRSSLSLRNVGQGEQRFLTNYSQTWYEPEGFPGLAFPCGPPRTCFLSAKTHVLENPSFLTPQNMLNADKHSGMDRSLLILSHIMLIPLGGNTGCSPLLANSREHYFWSLHGLNSPATPSCRFSPISSAGAELEHQETPSTV